MRIAPTLEELVKKNEAYREQDKKDLQKSSRFMLRCVVFSFSMLTLSFLFSVWLLWR